MLELRCDWEFVSPGLCWALPDILRNKRAVAGMGLAPLNTPAQHQQKGARRGVNPQATLCTSVPQSPTRITPLRGVVSSPTTPVEETSQSPRRRSNLFTWNGTDLTTTFVEEVAPEGGTETSNPPTPALYYRGGVVHQPGLAGADMVTLGLALHQQACNLPKEDTNTTEEVMNGVNLARESTGRRTRFWNGRILLGLGSLLVAGGCALLSHSNKGGMNTTEEK